jgi:predicted transcriptional regulator
VRAIARKRKYRIHSQEKRDQARYLLAQGWSYKAIARELGASQPSVRRWCDDQYREASNITSRAWKEKNRGTCEICGVSTWAGSSKCLSCSGRNRRYWTRERVIEAIQKWAAEHGAPPTAPQWQRAGEYHPAATACYGKKGVFPRWADAIEAAGFPRPVTKSPGPGKSTWSKDEARKLRRQGLMDTEIAERFGVTAGAISNRIGRRNQETFIRKRRTREERIADLQRALEQEE